MSEAAFCSITEFYFTPELHLRDGRIIRDLDDAARFAREQEIRLDVTKFYIESSAPKLRKRLTLPHIPLCGG